MKINDYGSAEEADPWSYNMVRCGRVTGRRLTNTGAQCKVFYDDRQVESDWLPVGQNGSKGHVFYNPPPQIGDQVTVLHYPTGIERGIVLCSNPTLRTPSFVPRSIDSVALQALDGSYFEYDPTIGCLSINGISTVYLNSKGQIHVITGGDLDADVTGNVAVTVGGNVSATVSGNLTASVTGSATVTASPIKLNNVNIDSSGNVTIPGNLTVNGATTTVQNLTINGTETGGGST